MKIEFFQTQKIALIILLSYFPGKTYSQESQKESDAKLTVVKVEWLTGNWNRTNIRLGRAASEKWTRVSGEELSGVGITKDGETTIFTEKLRIIVKDRQLWYVADVPENKEPVYFKMTVISDNEFICDNPEHDFPKKIHYKRDGNKMTAVISGNGKSIEFLFVKE